MSKYANIQRDSEPALECSRKDEHIAMFYALHLIDRLLGDLDMGVSPQTAGYIRYEVKKALATYPAHYIAPKPEK